MANERQRSINQGMRTSFLVESRPLLIAISRVWSLHDAVLGGDAS
jgi:hypothetical protein